MRSTENCVGVLNSRRALDSREICSSHCKSIFVRHRHIVCVHSDETMKVIFDALDRSSFFEL